MNAPKDELMNYVNELMANFADVREKDPGIAHTMDKLMAQLVDLICKHNPGFDYPTEEMAKEFLERTIYSCYSLAMKGE